jgi:hypothetical protein
MNSKRRKLGTVIRDCRIKRNCSLKYTSKIRIKQTNKEFIFIQEEIRGIKQTKGTLEQLALAANG